MKRFIKYLMKFLIVSIMIIFSMQTAYSQASKVTLNELVHRLIEKNFDVRLAALHYLMATSDKDQFQAKYGFYLHGSAGYGYSESPEKGRNFLYEGAQQKQQSIQAFLSKSFHTGTRVSVGVSSTYQDTGVNPDDIVATLSADPSTAAFAPLFEGMVTPPYYNSALILELRQSLLRNFLGRGERDMMKILDNVSEQKKLVTLQVLSGLIVEALVYYWNIAILEENVQALQEQLESTKKVRTITQRKIRLGLAESIELLQWDSLIVMYKNQIRIAQKDLREGRRKLLQAVHLPENTIIDASASLYKMKMIANFDTALKIAYQKRPDLQSARLQLKNAELALDNTKREMLPVLDLVLRAQSKGRDSGFGSSYQDVPSIKYPSYYIGVEVTAPLYATGLKDKIRDYSVQMAQAKTQYNQLRDNIAKEIENFMDDVQTMYDVYQGALQTQKIAYQYYQGVLRRFRQGRYSTVVVKQALDNYTKSRLETTRILVAYNVAILRLQFAQNEVMERFGLNRKKVEHYLNSHFKQKNK